MFSSPRAVQTLDTHFWLYHFWLPLLFVVPTLYLFEYTSIDTVFADFWYQLEGGYWALRKNWFTYEVMHRGGKQLIIFIGLVLMVLYAASWKVKRLRPWRWSFAFAIIAMILVPSTVSFLKHVSAVPCPWDFSRYGGRLTYMHNLQYTLQTLLYSATDGGSHCFPAGHSSSGFGLLAVYFAFGPFVKKNRLWLLLPGLAVGIFFGLAQQLRGAHFISQDLWSVSISWFGMLLLLKLAWRFKSPGDEEPVSQDTVP